MILNNTHILYVCNKITSETITRYNIIRNTSGNTVIWCYNSNDILTKTFTPEINFFICKQTNDIDILCEYTKHHSFDYIWYIPCEAVIKGANWFNFFEYWSKNNSDYLFCNADIEPYTEDIYTIIDNILDKNINICKDFNILKFYHFVSPLYRLSAKSVYYTMYFNTKYKINNSEIIFPTLFINNNFNIESISGDNTYCEDINKGKFYITNYIKKDKLFGSINNTDIEVYNHIQNITNGQLIYPYTLKRSALLL